MKLLQLMETDCTEIKREAAWVLSNATAQGKIEDVHGLVQVGMLNCFVKLLDLDDVKTIAVVLEALNNILKKGANMTLDRGENPYISLLESL